MSDPEVHKKLDTLLDRQKVIHEDVKDVKGEFKTLHDRADREGQERNWSLVGIRQAIHDLEQRLISWWRGGE